MKFNKKSLMKLAILSSILGLSGMFLGDVARGAEAADALAFFKQTQGDCLFHGNPLLKKRYLRFRASQST